MEESIIRVDYEQMLDNVFGYEDNKKELIRIIEWFNNKDLLTNKKITLPKGILLYGDPGCGKTLLLRTLINSLNAKVFVLKANKDNVVNEITEIYSKARKEEFAIVVIDELDLLVEKNKEVTRALQQELDGVDDTGHVLTIAAANNIYDIRSPLMRTGRFDRVMYFGSPNYELRKQLFKKFSEELGLDMGNVNINVIARPGCDSVVQIKAICNDVYLRSGGKPSNKDFRASREIMNNRFESTHDYKDYRVAVHEAGHVIAALAYNKNFNFYEARFTCSGGFTEYSVIDERKDSIEKREQRIVSALVGAFAEKTIFGKYEIGSSSDFDKARAMCEEFVQRTCIFGFSHLTAGVYISHCPDNISWLKHFYDEIYINKLMNKYKRKAQRLMNKNKKSIVRIAEIMMDKGEFNYEDASNIKIRI